MIIGLPRTRSVDEYRIGLSPRAVASLVESGAEIVVERNAGLGSGFSDDQYDAAGGRIVHDLDEVYGRADVIVKVNRPSREELPLLREGQVLMAAMHLAVAETPLVDALRRSGCTAIDYVTIQDERGNLPVLRPLSQIAGRMVPQIAARYLQTDHGGQGILLGGAPAVPPAEVVIIGAGTVGRNAVRACLGAGARVTLLDTDFDRITEIDWTFPGRITTFTANEATLRKVLRYANVVVGAVLIPGARTPHLVTREMVGLMKEKSLIIDISVDQGGCFETSRPTRLSDPTYVYEGITHYCVPNLSSLVARSASHALGNAIHPYLKEIALGRLEDVLRADPALARGVNVMAGRITHKGLADALGEEAVALEGLLPEGRS